MNIRPLFWTVIGVAVFALLLVVGVVRFRANLEHILGLEILKLVYQYVFQFLLIVVLGSLVTYCYSVLAKYREQQASALAKDREKAADERRTCQELRQKFYDEYIQTVYEAVKVHYLLRAKAVREDQVDHTQYDELMQRVLNVTIGLASLKGRVESDTILFRERRDSLVENLAKITDYFNNLINEYESARAYFTGDPLQAKCVDLKALDEFVRAGDDFVKKFGEPNKNIGRDLQELLIPSATEPGAQI